MLNNRVTPGPGIFIDDAAGGGKQISTTPGASGGTVAVVSMFQILRRTINNSQKWGIANDSIIRLNGRASGSSSQMVVTGTLTSDTPTDTDSGWKPIVNNDAIWLKIGFGTWPAIATAVIESIGSGAVFGGGRVEYQTTGGGSPTYTQTFGRVIIGSAISSASGFRVFQEKLGCPIILNSGEEGQTSSGSTPKGVPVVMPYFL